MSITYAIHLMDLEGNTTDWYSLDSNSEDSALARYQEAASASSGGYVQLHRVTDAPFVIETIARTD